MKTQKKLDEMTVKFENADTHYVAMFAFFKEHVHGDLRAKWATRLAKTKNVRANMKRRMETQEKAKAAEKELTLKRSKPSN